MELCGWWMLGTKCFTLQTAPVGRHSSLAVHQLGWSPASQDLGRLLVSGVKVWQGYEMGEEREPAINKPSCVHPVHTRKEDTCVSVQDIKPAR